MSLLLLLQTEAGGGSSESLAAGDLTTAFAKWLASRTMPKNEDIRGDLNTHYSRSDQDIQYVLSRFLKDRQ